MKASNELIIIGGGASVKEGMVKGLWDKIDNKFTFGINFSYKFFKSTAQIYCDEVFYKRQREELKKLSLIIGMTHKSLVTEPNTVTLTTATRYFRNLSNGVYCADLAGLFALSLGIYVLDVGTVYLLGYDFGEIRKKDLPEPIVRKEIFMNNTERDKKNRLITHWYQGKCEHRGVGKTSYYHCKKRPTAKFKCYKEEKRCKIYNVNPTSRIPGDIIEKIDYDTFFKKLNKNKYNQIELCNEIKKKLNA